MDREPRIWYIIIQVLIVQIAMRASPQSSENPVRAPLVAASQRLSPIVILDDDPTGAQLVADTLVVLDWAPEVLRQLPDRPFHVLTNTRAHSASEAYQITRRVSEQVRRRFPQAQLVLRGDSTLRAHLREEYDAVREVAFPHAAPVLLLVPALPTAGRITLGGVHFIERNGTRVALSQTEYALDGGFSYSHARLLRWAQERSGGLFDPDNGVEVPLDQLHRTRGAAVHNALATCASSERPAVCVPDATSLDDLTLIAAGLRAALEEGVPIVVRCAPAFAAVLAGTLATSTLSPPRAERLLVVCGSYVPETTRQLAHVQERHPGSLVRLRLGPILGDHPERELSRAVGVVEQLFERDRLAIVTTPRRRTAAADNPELARRITDGLAQLTRRVAGRADLVLFKGGITAAVGIRQGLGSRLALVEGPLGDGAALWRVEDGRRCIVFPGNVGRSDSLSRIVDKVLG